MLWFGKKNKNSDIEKNETEESIDILFEEFADAELTEEQILEALNEEDLPVYGTSVPDEEVVIEDNGEGKEDFEAEQSEASEDGDSLSEVTEENSSEEENPNFNEEEKKAAPEEITVTKILTTFDELCDYVSRKPIGCIQYMRKTTKEVFQLREAHLRIASAWESISIYKNYSEKDYAKIILANELMENPDDFWVLPILLNDEMQMAIKGFCLEYYRENGKKYAKHPEKFTKLIKENDHVEEWIEYSKELLSNKLRRFCKKNGITFDDMPINEEAE